MGSTLVEFVSGFHISRLALSDAYATVGVAEAADATVAAEATEEALALDAADAVEAAEETAAVEEKKTD